MRTIGRLDPASAAPRAPAAIRLADYSPPAWELRKVRLDVALEGDAAIVTSTLELVRAAGADPAAPLRLDGRGLTPIEPSIDGAPTRLDDLEIDDEGLTVPARLLPGQRHVWRCQTRLLPQENTALEGLYASRDMLCTQCEAEGFRKIAYFLDRPDVMAPFETRIEADQARFPVLLSNGERAEAGALENGRHFALWRDPHPKPAYLFALVAGDLVATDDAFRTASGADVALRLYTRRGDEGRSAYALEALKRSMAWDERVYGREYDLNIFMIVAVDDFNMGAMENKGLNIFNSKYVLSSPETATDRDYELIESVVAHEYFHNWTGNRVTCRDWFQLCLKEGLTVFRDQQFSADERSEAVTRIETVRTLRARQFREDAGPLAHPVRPEEYIEINNFYTATVYEKGAELVRMLHTLLGADLYRAALDLYFERHDGEACTVEQFVACFESVSGRDLTHFFRWWRQAGTPSVTAETALTPSGTLRLILRQETAPTPGQPVKEPLHIPFKFGFLAPDGTPLALTLQSGPAHAVGDAAQSWLAELTETETTLEFSSPSGLAGAVPQVSLNRSFSAPVLADPAGPGPGTRAERLAFLLAHDPDPVTRWDAGRTLVADTVLKAADAILGGSAPEPAHALHHALASALGATGADPAFLALLLSAPGIDELAGLWVARERGQDAPRPADPDALHAARTHLRLGLAQSLETTLAGFYDALETPGPYAPTAAAAGRRALRNAALDLLTQTGAPEAVARAKRQFAGADNMTDQLPALTALVHTGASGAEEALAAFYGRWRGDALVLGKWFGVQATRPLDDALERVDALTRHAAFDWRNPNKFRALIGAFAMANPTAFHRLDGSGYAFFADWLIRLDPVNPQTAAKLVSAFETWRWFDDRRQTLIQDALGRISSAPGLSKDTAEMVERIRG